MLLYTKKKCALCFGVDIFYSDTKVAVRDTYFCFVFVLALFICFVLVHFCGPSPSQDTIGENGSWTHQRLKVYDGFVYLCPPPPLPPPGTLRLPCFGTPEGSASA